jgi:L-2-hydroxyglutarate oxidase LhgO
MILVIGGGVVGLACAWTLARQGREVCLLERHARTGVETSTRNSGVIHAGLYYPAGSLKGVLCVEGRERLYAFCREYGVPHVRCGKLVITSVRSGATDAVRVSQHADLDRVQATAAANGAVVERVDAAFVRAREPHVRADAALWSPDTGWVDADALVRRLQHDAIARGAVVLTGTPAVGIEPRGESGLDVITPRERIEAHAVVNAAGLYADEVSALAGGERFTIYPCRGEYAELAPHARHLVNGLVYPVPDASGHGLGVHLTRTIAGAVWIGPTIQYQESKTDYEGGRLPLEAFLGPTRELLPAVRLEDLRASGSGIRPKLHPASERFADFLIRRDARNPFLVHAAGIDSPGLTASLAIAERVASIID